MYCFLLGLSVGRGLLSRVTRSAQITRQLMPELGLPSSERVISLPELRGGAFVIHPTQPPHRPLLHERVGERWAVIVYGEIDCAGAGDPATKLLARWERDGVDGVRQLEGCFGAFVIDRRRRELYLVSDLIGCRSLRYWVDKNCLLVSSHDIPLVATGLCSTELDEVSACSAVCCDWSIGGASMLKGVKVCSPNGYVRWREGVLEQVDRPSILFDVRLATQDRQGRRAKVRELVRLLRQRAQSRFSQEERIRVDLTAGADSRAVLAVMMSTIDPSKLQVLTTGRPTDLDARVARSICRHYGLHHELIEAPVPSADNFVSNLSPLAFYFNGDTNGKRACLLQNKYDVKAPISVGGGGGEIFRGYYYPPRYPVSRLDAAAAARYIFERRFQRLRKLTGIRQAVRYAVAERIQNQFELYAMWSHEPWDWFDLFYLYERYGRWSLPNRWIFQPPKYFLFDGPVLVQSAYQLPAPIGRHCHLHRAVVRELSSYLYWLPINGNSMYVFHSTPLLGHAAAKIGRALASLGTSFTSRSQRRPGTTGTHYADSLRQLVNGEARALLEDARGVTAALFGGESIRQVIKEHGNGRVDHTETLGALFTLECWRGLVDEASRLAGGVEKSR